MAEFPLSPLTAISAVDGRYREKCAALSDYFSEYALIKYRVIVEIQWLISLSSNPDIVGKQQLGSKSRKFLQQLADQFNLSDAERVKLIEATTNHDVKAVEYFIKE
ncbi:MAG: adenylosuccinate lyase, partial [Pseudohongiellaceae bacterium]